MAYKGPDDNVRAGLHLHRSDIHRPIASEHVAIKFLREPLGHFLLLEAAVFVVESLVSEDRGRNAGQRHHPGRDRHLVATSALTLGQ